MRVIGEQVTVQRHAPHIAFAQQAVVAGQPFQGIAHCNRNCAMEAQRKSLNGLCSRPFRRSAGASLCSIGGGRVRCGGFWRHLVPFGDTISVS